LAKFLLGADFVGVAQQRTHEALFERLERDDVLAAGQHHPPDRDPIHLADRFADHGKCVLPDLAVWTQVVGADDVSGIDLVPGHELVDLDGARGFQCDVF
jgi:hypothetical protein